MTLRDRLDRDDEFSTQGEDFLILREQLDRLTLVVNTAPGLIAYWGRDLICRFANQSYGDWFGRSASEMTGIAYETLLGVAVAARNRPMVDAVLSGQPQRFEQSLIQSNGEEVSTLTDYVPDVIASGEVRGFIAHVTDVTTLKQTEQALLQEAATRQRVNRIVRDQALALEEAQRLGQIGSWSWTIASDDVRWSKELFRIMGRDPGLPALSFADHGAIYADRSWKALQAAVDVASRTGAPYRLDLEYVRPDASRGWLEARGEVVRDARGTITGLRGTVRALPAQKPRPWCPAG